MPVIVGFDRHPASRAALRFAGDLAGALHTHVHVVHVMDLADDAAISSDAGSAGGVSLGDRDRIEAALRDVAVQWSHHVATGDPATALLRAAAEHSASLIVVGRPEQGIGATLGHIMTGAVARSLIRRSECPVVVVPDLVEATR